MKSRLTLVVEQGTASLGRSLDLPPGRSTIGGRGSGAEIELADLPAGIPYVSIEGGADGWTLEELTSDVVRLDGRAPRRTNPLASGSRILLPRADGQGAVELVARIGRGAALPALPSLRQLYDGPGFYVLALLFMAGLAALYLAVFETGAPRAAPAPAPAALVEEMAALVLSQAPAAPLVALPGAPRNLAEARAHAAAAPDDAARRAVARAFGEDVVLRLSRARRLERLGLRAAARDAYSDVVVRLQSPDTTASRVALRALAQLD